MTGKLRLVILVVIAFSMLPTLLKAISLNVAGVVTIRGLGDYRSLAGVPVTYDAVATSACRVHWFQGFLAHNSDVPLQRDKAWEEAMRCSPEHVLLTSLLLPDNVALAEHAVDLQPTSADAWFWLARLRVPAAPDEASKLFQRGLEIRPRAALEWLELGDLLMPRDPRAAMDAYLQSCLNGDPGFHGCLRAGRLAEQLGDIRTAIDYYRLSYYPPARERAAQLEQQVSEGQ